MYLCIIAAIIFLIIFLTVYQKIRFDFSISEKSSVVIDYSILSLSIKQTNSGKNSNIPSVHLIKSILKALKRTLPQTAITIKRIELPSSSVTPFIYGCFFAILAPFLALTDAQCENAFMITNTYSDHPTFDFTLECRLYIFIYAAICLISDILKRRIRSSVRKQSKRHN